MECGEAVGAAHLHLQDCMEHGEDALARAAATHSKCFVGTSSPDDDYTAITTLSSHATPADDGFGEAFALARDSSKRPHARQDAGSGFIDAQVSLMPLLHLLSGT